MSEKATKFEKNLLYTFDKSIVFCACNSVLVKKSTKIFKNKCGQVVLYKLQKTWLFFPKIDGFIYIFSPSRAKNSTTMPNLVSLLYQLSWKQRILRYCDLDWHLNPWLMQGNVPKQSFPEKEKKKKRHQLDSLQQ